MPQFTGFSKKTFAFLGQLEKNNNREWFEDNKQRYLKDVLDPALDFIATIAPSIHDLSDYFDAIPKRTGGSLMRVYRDMRFVKDKRPYKTNIGIQFRHQFGKDIHAPGYYLHVEKDNCFLAAGLWRPEPRALAGIRALIKEKPVDWGKAVQSKAFKQAYTLGGRSLTRPPKGYTQEDPFLEDLKRKDFMAAHNFSSQEAMSADFVKMVKKKYGFATPYMRFLCEGVGIPF